MVNTPDASLPIIFSNRSMPARSRQLSGRNAHAGMPPAGLPADETSHVLDQHRRLLDLREEVESVINTRVVRHLRLHSIRPQTVEVLPLPVLQRIQIPHHHHHRREPVSQLRYRRRRRFWVRRRMVPRSSSWKKRLPQPIRALEMDGGHSP